MTARGLFLLAPLSGALALIYQSLWQRELRLLLGSGPVSFALTVGLFLGALFVGYWYFGRRSQNRSAAELPKDLAIAEAGIGFFALVSAAFIYGEGLNLPLSLFLIAAPVFLMGCFLPICAQWLSILDPNSRPEASLYAAHGIGAAVGAWLCGLFLLSEFGSILTLAFTGLAHLVLAVVLWRQGSLPPGTSPSSSPLTRSPAAPSKIRAQVFLAGFAGIGLQMLSYRITTLVVGDSTFVFSLVLGSFVLMIAGGGWLARQLPERLPWKFLLLLPLVNVSVLIAFTPSLPEFAAWSLKPVLSLPGGFWLFHLLVVLGLLGAFGSATLILAALTPILVRRFVTDTGRVGHAVGHLWSWNTLGCLAATAGFGLLFFLVTDLRGSILILLVVIGTLALSMGLRPLFLLPAFFTVVLPWNREALIHSEIQSGRVGWPKAGYQVTVYEDAPLGSFAIAAFRVDDVVAHRLVANGRFEGASISRHAYASKLTVDLPFNFLHGNRLRTALVGLGAGRSLQALTRDDRAALIDAFEISSTVAKFQRYFFPVGANPMDSKKLRVFVQDAYTGIPAADGMYDLIASEPSQLWAAGVAPLYTRQFYAAVKSKLTDGGVFTQWVPSYALSTATLARIVATWREAFPDSRAYLFRGDLILLGSNRPLVVVDASRYREFSSLEVPMSTFGTSLEEPFVIHDTALENWAWRDHLDGADARLDLRIRPSVDPSRSG